MFWAWMLGASCGLAGAGQVETNETRWRDLPHTDTEFKPIHYATLAEWKERRRWLCDQVRFAAGLWPEPDRTPLNAKVFGRLQRDGYTIEKVYFESQPGLYVTGNLYRPRGVSGKAPAVACPHGHWPKGRLNHDDLGSIPARCIMLARLGAVVFSYDMIGYHDSGRQFEHRDAALNTPQQALWGLGSLHFQTWNSIRVLDFLESLPDVDPQRFAATGASGGGTQTFILCAIDERVKVAAPVNMISSTMQGGCSCENAATLRIETNNMEIGALLAPKPLLLVSATGDWTKNTPTVEYPMIRGVYELYGAADRVRSVHVDAPHNYNLASREAVYRFFARWLLVRDDADTIREENIQVEKPEDLLVFSGEVAPPRIPSLGELAPELKAAARKRIESLRPSNPQKLAELARIVRFGVAHAVASSLPTGSQVSCREEGTLEAGLWPGRKLVYERNGRAVPAARFVSTLASKSPTSVTMCVHPKGLAAQGELRELIERRANLGDYVLLVEPFGAGTNRPPDGLEKPRGSTKFFSTFNRTDAAEAVFDILTVLGALLGDDRLTHVHLVGLGETGPVCLLARTLVPDEVVQEKRLRTVIDLNAFEIDSEEAYVKQLMVPGILRIGGLRTAAAVAANGPLWLHNAGKGFDARWVEEAGRAGGVETRADPAAADPAAIADWLTAAHP